MQAENGICDSDHVLHAAADWVHGRTKHGEASEISRGAAGLSDV